MSVEFWFVIGLLAGLVLGLSINSSAIQERDDRINELEKKLKDDED